MMKIRVTFKAVCNYTTQTKHAKRAGCWMAGAALAQHEGPLIMGTDLQFDALGCVGFKLV